MSNITFSDIADVDWAEKYIYYLANQDPAVVSGIGDGTFAPRGEVSIGQLCTIACNAAGIEPEPVDGHWARKFVNYVGGKMGLRLFPEVYGPELSISQLPDSAIDEPIQRQFAFNATWRIVATSKRGRFSGSPDMESDFLDFYKRFKDYGDVDDSAVKGVYKLWQHGIVSGRQVSGQEILAPKEHLTRAELSRLFALCLADEVEIDEFLEGLVYEKTLYNIKNDTSLDLDEQKKNTIIGIGRTMLHEGYELSFVAGMLANIIHEGSAGLFEKDRNGQHQDYIRYMNDYFDYANKFSNKYIYKQYATCNMSLSEIYEILLSCEPNGWVASPPDNRRRGFGLGSVQWTFARTKKLVEFYREVAGTSDTITFDQVLRAEGLMISREFKGYYDFVYSNWLSSNSSRLNTDDAAYEAGYTICVDYEVPPDRYNKGVARGMTARALYNIMAGR